MLITKISLPKGIFHKKSKHNVCSPPYICQAVLLLSAIIIMTTIILYQQYIYLQLPINVHFPTPLSHAPYLQVAYSQHVH